MYNVFTIRSIPMSTVIDYRRLYTSNNLPIEDRFKLNEAWSLFEITGRRKYALNVASLLEHEYETYFELAKANKIPPMPKSLYEHMKSFAEINVMMLGGYT